MSATDQIMPTPAPLPMRKQAFDRVPVRHPVKLKKRLPDLLWRVAAFAPALLVTLLLSVAIGRRFAEGGVTFAEGTVIALVAITFIWVSLSVSTVLVGITRRLLNPCVTRYSRVRGSTQNVALLVPIYNEVPADVFGNASAMLKELAHGPKKDAFTLFVLSDTRDEAIAEQELHALSALRATAPRGVDIYYRRRAKNTDKKVGNITDWIEGWGGAYEAMIVLDADSLMSGAAIRQLAHELAAHPEAGLIQSFPVLIGAETLFGRMQQFSNSVYGWLLAEGLATWYQSEGNYWGHNAIIRTKAFADSAHLPYLRGRRGKEDLILSHDFVEAGMLRRAGWAVRFMPRTGGSYEEAPQTLIDYALRDRRWCQGNMQHLRLLATRGFHPVSRFHLLQGAVAFLLSPAWFALVVIWSLISTMPEQALDPIHAANPFYPVWPKDQPIDGLIFLAFIYTMLLMPKITGVLALGLRRRTRDDYGGWFKFVGTGLLEIVCSVIYAPVLMVQQTIAVVFAALGRSKSWTPQVRQNSKYTWAQTLRFHWVETVVGIAMAAGILTGTVSIWLAPIAFSLTIASPLSMLSGAKIRNRALRLNSPQCLREPRVVRRARAERARMTKVLEAANNAPDTPAIAAE
ncbi:glucans biosynthesis glucosyltransferase MdoH [Rhodobacteraceae bacterium]|nr:glucans biosynthesis glucosyltransferase MdoH [Paracoccaceae bacterium]